VTYIKPPAVAGSGSTPVSLSAGPSASPSVTLNRIGTWVVVVASADGSYSQTTGGVPSKTVTIGGTAGVSYSLNTRHDSSNTSANGTLDSFGYQTTVVTTNTTSTVTVSMTTSALTETATFTITAYFIPTPAHPN
jgi:hypothetical protein